MSYSIQLISPEEKDKLYETYEPRLLYTSKAEIYGCCIKILTDSESTKNKGKTTFSVQTKTAALMDVLLF
jgi:hypothetical protein